MKHLVTFLLLFAATGAVHAQKLSKTNKSKIAQDREVILSMVGCYEVSFQFAETFSPNKDYKYYDRKFEKGIETVFVVEETPTKIALQHILVVNDTMVVKHWRQDWIYENRDFLVYQGNNTFKRMQLPAQTVKGTWTQKVYQVDDSPRYEGFGTWVHVDGRHFWQSRSDAPLPRREFTVRNDYNILRRFSTMEILADGWMLEQDNQKINRTAEGTESLIAWEKGFERFTKGNYNCDPAMAWWNEQQRFWDDVRVVWGETFKQEQIPLDFSKKTGQEPLFQLLFKKGDEVSARTEYKEEAVRQEIKQIIHTYLTQKS